ncbi:unnamed protein product [Didymodactylos carnosus]|uniref:RRM domain-containing protein n=1 Tax=Didymodactylos carnosus TaxID=1234261 RepID=A0A813UBM6_9BILA|nr:unnamed protein product [Didymodactylos carnosus]CAF3611092.1 unnamed protein product [Didymodactylos carnosus]
MGFGNLESSEGLNLLNAFLSDKSYIEGYQPSKGDIVVFEAVKKSPPKDLENAFRWFKHISSFDDNERQKFKGERKAIDQYGRVSGQDSVEKHVFKSLSHDPHEKSDEKTNTTTAKPAKSGNDDDIDLFGSDDEDDEEAKRIRDERLKTYAEKKSKKPGPIAKSSIVLDIKPWEDTTDLVEMERLVRGIELDGLVWGASRLVPLAFTIKKLQINCVVEDDKMAAIETKLYVTNFPSSATRQQLQLFFGRFGRVQECAIMWNSYAFVHYSNIDEAKRALEQANGALFLNRKLIVQLSTSRFRPNPKEITNGGGENVDNGLQDSFATNGDNDGWINNTRQNQQHSSPLNYMNEPSYNVDLNRQCYSFQNGHQQHNNTNNDYSSSSLQQKDNQCLPSYYPQHDNNSQNYHPLVNDSGLLSTLAQTPPPSSVSNDHQYYNRFDLNMNHLQQQYINGTALNYNKIASSSTSSCSNNGSTNGEIKNRMIFPNNDSGDATVATNKNISKIIRTDIGANSEIPKLYVTNLPDNCKANDLQRLFSNYGVVVDCVILWDYYAFITYRKFSEAELALQSLHGQMWKERRLIVEWSRASGRRQTTTTSTGMKKDQVFNTSPLLNGEERQQKQSYLTNKKDVSQNLFITNNSNLSQPLSPSKKSPLSQLDQSSRVRPATLSYLPHYQQQQFASALSPTTMISPTPTVQTSSAPLPQSPQQQQQVFSVNRNLMMLSLLQHQQQQQLPKSSSPVQNHPNVYLGGATPPPGNGANYSENTNTLMHNSFPAYAGSNINSLADNNATFERLAAASSSNKSPLDNLLFSPKGNSNNNTSLKDAERTQQHTMSDIVALLDGCTSDQSETKSLSDLRTTSAMSCSSSTRAEPPNIFNNESILSSLFWNIDFPAAVSNASIKQSVLNKLFESKTDCFENHQENMGTSSQQSRPYSYHLTLTTAPENNYQSSMYCYNGWN